jgi:hypothetical protein
VCNRRPVHDDCIYCEECQYEVLLQAPLRKATIGLPAVLGESFDAVFGVGRGSLHESRCRATTAKRGLLRSTRMPITAVCKFVSQPPVLTAAIFGGIKGALRIPSVSFQYL